MYMWGVEGSDCGYSAPGAAALTTLHDIRDQPTEVLFHDKNGRMLSRSSSRTTEWGTSWKRPRR